MILGKGSTQELDDITLTAEAEQSVNFTEQVNKFFLSLHYNKSNNYLFVNATKYIDSKQKTLK